MLYCLRVWCTAYTIRYKGNLKLDDNKLEAKLLKIKALAERGEGGEKESAILRADAEKQAAILRAEGQAEAILAVQRATAEAMRLLNESCPNDQVIKLKALEAMQKIADGQATKIIIPSEMQGLVGLANGITEGVTPSTRPVVK